MSEPGEPTRRRLARDLVVFQFKLAVDGLRDLAMSPVSLFAGAAGLVVGRPAAKRLFYEVLAFGRRTERWIDLFGDADRLPLAASPGRQRSFDSVIEEVEAMLVEQYRSGGITAKARRTLEHALATLRQDR